MRTTLAQALSPASRICECLNLSPTDSRVLGWINSATMRLLTKGKWIGTVDKYTVKITNQLMTLPPVFAVAEQCAVSHHPTDLRNQWFEFNPGGWGVVDDPTTEHPVSWNSAATQRGNACSFADIPAGSPMQLSVQCDVAADVGEQVLLLGLDGNGNWIRDNPGGLWQDGVLVSLAQVPGTLSVYSNGSPAIFSKITGVQKPITSGQIWLNTWNGSTYTTIGHYQFWEVNPWYTRYLIPMCPGNSTQVDIMGKLAFRPVANPTDWLLIGNLEALRLACLALRMEEIGTEQALVKARLYMNGQRDAGTGRIVQDGALTILDEELNHYRGSGAVLSTHVEGAGFPPVPTFI